MAQQDIFYDPDLRLSCDPDDRETDDCSRPCLLVEVLSSSTARIDRAEKCFAYQTIASLQEYLVVEQDARAVEVPIAPAAGPPSASPRGACASIVSMSPCRSTSSTKT
ncbi:Uma2 family endonuclease [Thiorhodococcus minor]|uniref:Uma2 family endonuclease n=1 Tax=Thiorhodococcus minor TaxID=57489 RepID=UPI0031597EBC